MLTHDRTIPAPRSTVAVRFVLRIEFGDAAANQSEHRSDVATTRLVEPAGDLESPSSRGDGSHPCDGVAAKRLERVVRTRGEALEAVVDDRDTQFERLNVSEELLPVGRGIRATRPTVQAAVADAARNLLVRSER
ncbi:hypothetical protein [Agromyces sp. Marseille-Q5079]|uniref:hypothetical protein n=1 Tax=Agromyces sp. Marseille-Q5079 TaxID=3439059 RepID=UPI003D9C9028